MPAINKSLTGAVEAYFKDLQSIRASGRGTHERSYYPPLVNLLNSVGSSLRPRVFCVSEIVEQGAGHPDVGLFGAKQLQKGKLKQGQTPEAGVVEVKSAHDDAWLTAESAQVSRYWGAVPSCPRHQHPRLRAAGRGLPGQSRLSWRPSG